MSYFVMVAIVPAALHSVEIDIVSNLFELCEIDDQQWHQYTWYHA